MRARGVGEEHLKISLMLVNISLGSRKAIPFAEAFRAKLERCLERPKAAAG